MLGTTYDTSPLKKVTYPGTGNNSQFTYDGLGQCVKIVETVAGSVTSTKQFVRCDNEMCEARNASSAITAQYFSHGETISGTSYYFTLIDPPGSVGELTNTAGAVQAQYAYDPYGRVMVLQGSVASDFQYAGYYYHAPSGLNLTRTRVYSASLGRWLSRDIIQEAAGVNLFAYVGNSPIERTDPKGTDWGIIVRPYVPNPWIGEPPPIFSGPEDPFLGPQPYVPPPWSNPDQWNPYYDIPDKNRKNFKDCVDKALEDFKSHKDSRRLECDINKCRKDWGEFKYWQHKSGEYRWYPGDRQPSSMG